MKERGSTSQSRWPRRLGSKGFWLTLALGTYLTSTYWIWIFLWWLISGWFWFLRYTLPAVRPHGEMIIASVVATGLLLLMVHRFARWMAASVVRSRGEDSAPVSWRWRWTLCLVSGVLMIFVAAVAAIGIFHQIGWLSRSGVIYVAREEPAVKAGLEYAQNLTAVLRKRDAGLSVKGPSARREWSSEERAILFSSYESEWSWMVTAPSHRQDGKIALYGRSRQIGWSWVIRYRELFPADRAQLERNAAIEAEVTSGVAAP